MADKNATTSDEGAVFLPDMTSAGQTVRIGDGPLAGFEGIIVDRRPSGRYLVRLYQGVFVETNLIRFDHLTESA